MLYEVITLRDAEAMLLVDDHEREPPKDHALLKQGMLDAAISVTPALSVPKDPSHGDFATNIALQIAKPMGVPPMLRMNGDLVPIRFRDLGGPELESYINSYNFV